MDIAESARDSLELLLPELQRAYGSARLANEAPVLESYLVVQILGSPLGNELLLDLPVPTSALRRSPTRRETYLANFISERRQGQTNARDGRRRSRDKT